MLRVTYRKPVIFTGPGLNVHRELVPEVAVANYLWVRIDGPESGVSWATMRALCTHYKSMGKKIMLCVKVAENASRLVAHVYDCAVELAGYIDAIEPFNEPSLEIFGGYTPQQVVDILILIRIAFRYTRMKIVLGPALPSWGAAEQAWWQTFKALGGCELLDGITQHLYDHLNDPLTLGAMALSQKAEADSVGLPYYCSEAGLMGGWLANMVNQAWAVPYVSNGSVVDADGMMVAGYLRICASIDLNAIAVALYQAGPGTIYDQCFFATYAWNATALGTAMGTVVANTDPLPP